MVTARFQFSPRLKVQFIGFVTDQNFSPPLALCNASASLAGFAETAGKIAFSTLYKTTTSAFASKYYVDYFG